MTMRSKSEESTYSIRVVLQTFPPFFSTSFCRICPTGWSIYQARLVWWSGGYATRLVIYIGPQKGGPKPRLDCSWGLFFFLSSLYIIHVFSPHIIIIYSFFIMVAIYFLFIIYPFPFHYRICTAHSHFYPQVTCCTYIVPRRP